MMDLAAPKLHPDDTASTVGKSADGHDEEQVKELHAKIGQLAVANSFLGAKAEAFEREVRRGMIAPNHPNLYIGQQCKLLSIARSSYYYEPKGETEQNLDLVRQIDEQFLEPPFFGVRQMT